MSDAALRVQNGAYRTLNAHLEQEIAAHRAKAREYDAAIKTLDSEREANAILTATIEVQARQIADASKETAEEAGSVWRCATADIIAAIDCGFTDPLKNSKRKAERDLGERLDRVLQALFGASRFERPGDYNAAVDAGKRLIAIGKEAASPPLPDTGLQA